MYDHHHSRGLQIIAVPCNQFGAQEPNSSQEIKAWVQETYQIEFPILEKIDVTGELAHPMYMLGLSKQLPDSKIKWNFAKYLINNEGKARKFYEPSVDPELMMPDIDPWLDAE